MRDIIDETINHIQLQIRELKVNEVVNYLTEIRDFCDNTMGGSNLSKLIDENIRSITAEEKKGG